MQTEKHKIGEWWKQVGKEWLAKAALFKNNNAAVRKKQNCRQ